MNFNIYKRIVIKLSGESLRNHNDNSLFAFDKINHVISGIKWFKNKYSNSKIAIVVGGGNIIRGREFINNNNNKIEIDQVTADYMGMISTSLNAIILRCELMKHGLKAKIKTGFKIEHIGELHDSEASLHDYEKGEIVIFACGIGTPFFSTDTTASLRALELKANLILFAKHGVDCVYDKDPNLYKDAKPIHETTFKKAINLNLQIIDPPAIGLLMNNKITGLVVNFKNLFDHWKKPEEFKGTIITN